MINSLYWVTKDLRIADNAALNLASQSDNLLCVYVVDKKWFTPNNYQSKPLGDHRWQFLQDSLSEFNERLLTLGQTLHVVYGDTLTLLTELCETHQITDVISTQLPSNDEHSLIGQLSTNLPDLRVNLIEQFTLFSQQQLPFEFAQFPVSYSAFRKKVTGIEVSEIVPDILSLPSSINNADVANTSRPGWLPAEVLEKSMHGNHFDAGERSGLEHLERYFSSNSPSTYKQVRNNLEGWANSSKFSPWLGHGCLSPRQVLNSINDYEQHHGKNSSTEWLYFELLWREYFQWLHFNIGDKIYNFKGLSDSPPLTSFYPERFKKWCYGNTPYPLVNACMNELRKTGYLSNRGRQIVASCLVNELSLDWRYGAAWFEEQLIDYDAASNWGNWQYIAGVGVDARGGRHFNLEKQATLFDPKGLYQEKWAEHPPQPLDSVDAADWPIFAATISANG